MFHITFAPSSQNRTYRLCDSVGHRENKELINCHIDIEDVVFMLSHGQNWDFWFGNPQFTITGKLEQSYDNSRIE